MKQWIHWFVGAAIATACGRSAGDHQLVEIKRGDLVIGVTVTGSLEAIDSTDVRPPTIGDTWQFKIASLAAEGAAVKAGEPIVGFDPSEQMKELQNVQTEVEAAKKQIDKKRDTMALARRDNELALVTSEANLRKAKLKLDAAIPDQTAANQLAELRLGVRSAEIELELAKNKADQTAKTDRAELAALGDKLTTAAARASELQQALAKMEVASPRAGTIVYPTNWGDKKPKVGDSVWRLNTVLKVVSLDKMQGNGVVDEVDIARVVKGQPVTLQLDALPDVQLHGKVDTIARTVRARSDNDPSNVLAVTVALDPTTAPLRPGMRFRGEIECERLTGVVMIPSDAVFVTGDGVIAYRDNGDGLDPVPVSLGRRSTTAIEVISGLAAGDRVSRSAPANHRRAEVHR